MKRLVLFAILLAMPSVNAAHKASSPVFSQSKRDSKTSQKKPLRRPSMEGPFSKRSLRQQSKTPQPRGKRKKVPTPKNSQSAWSSYSGEGYTISFPQAWQCIDDKAQLPEKLDVVFIGHGSGKLTPTLNIAQEVTSKTFSEYIEEVLAYHRTKDTTLESSIFTRIQSLSGEFTIVKTEKNSSWGRVYCLQAIAVLDHTAYIFTSTATLEDYPELSLIFLKTVASFELEARETSSGNNILEEALKKFEKESSRN